MLILIYLPSLGFMQDLLSASMDKTVRLWQVGCNSCLKVFSHTNYGKPFTPMNYWISQHAFLHHLMILTWRSFVCCAVTCVQFQPTSDNYFISGCIDGLVRIWDVRKCLVVDWANTKEIVTAVCYRPDGKVCSDILVVIRFYQVII